MGWDFLGPLGVFLGVLGGGVAWAYDKWQGRTERREDRMIDMLKAAKAEAEAERDAERAAKLSAQRRARSYWRQLIEAGITPDPEWGEDE